MDPYPNSIAIIVIFAKALLEVTWFCLTKGIFFVVHAAERMPQHLNVEMDQVRLG